MIYDLIINSIISESYPNVMQLNIIDKKNILFFTALYDDYLPLQWLGENKRHIINQKFFLEREVKGNTIFEKIKNFYDSEYADDDNYLDKIYLYKRSHGLNFAFRGVDCQEAYIGMIDKKYQISGKDFQYDLDIELFIESLEKALNEFNKTSTS